LRYSAEEQHSSREIIDKNPTQMSFKEKTLEFAKLVEELQQKKAYSQGLPQSKLISHATSNFPSAGLLTGKNGINAFDPTSSVPKSQFALVASQLGRQIQETTQKLSKLTNLAKNSYLFDHEKTAAEINQLTLVIKQDIQNLNCQIEALQNHVKSQKYLKKNKQTESHASSIVRSLKSELANTTKKFQKVLETRTENLKKQQEKRQKFEGSISPGRGDIFKPRAGLSSTGLAGDAAVAIGLNEPAAGPSSMMVPHQNGIHQPQQQMQSLLTMQDSYLNSRAVAVENIESTIIELQGIFQQLASIVAEQGEMMQRIDTNIEEARSNVDAAQGELLKYLHSISGNKWLIVKIFLVLIVFIIIFVVFFV
jgi:syntaxin 5